MSDNFRIDYIMDAVNESDYSDEDLAEYIALGTRPRSGNKREEMRYGMDVLKYYHELFQSDMDILSHRPSRKPTVSKFVQTRPELSGIPPMWLIAIEERVIDLYTGLGNMINKLYHTPSNCSSEEIKKKANPKKYPNGYWQSMSHPDIKVPVCSEKSHVNSHDFKKDLSNLLQTASELKYMIPYIAEYELEGQIQGTENQINGSQIGDIEKTEAASATTASGDVGSAEPQVSGSCINLLPPVNSSSDSDSVKSSCSSKSSSNGCRPKLIRTKGSSMKIPEIKITKSDEIHQNEGIDLPQHNTYEKSKHVEFSVFKLSTAKSRSVYVQTEGAGIDKCDGHLGEGESANHRSPLATLFKSDVTSNTHAAGGSGLLKNVKAKSLPNVAQGFDPSKEKNQTSKSKQTSKTASAASSGKNFIKRNILASRVPVIRSTIKNKDQKKI